jgi:hypothetical protein
MSFHPKTGFFLMAMLLALAGCKNSSTPSNTAQPNAENSHASTTPNESAQQAAAQPAPQPIVIPAGKILSVTIDQQISSKTSNNGDHFDASLAEPVSVEGAAVLPTGTRVTGVVTDAKSAGRFRGHAELGLALESVRFEGKTYRVHTSDVAESSKGRGKRTAVGGGGGAAFGAVVGALAGGGKGAAIGALAGGGAGSAGAAFTGQRDIVIPAETRLDFKLARSVTVTPNQ